ncbi:alpha/beta hydrolase [Actinomadura sp. 3N508]|uniref:alpha/beta hydrolase n=1 Tax=Actinomadura sp. 3N508 TaxID=3375153 RepID=UPI0037B75DFE
MPSVRKAAAIMSILAASVSAATATSDTDMYATPAPPPSTTSATLDLRYKATTREIESALATARRVHDSDRTSALTALLATGHRRFLVFDPRGRGRIVEVIGDLRRADRIAVVVPGADNSLTNYDSPKFAGGGSRALYRQARAAAPGTRLAVIAWLGYDSPPSLSTAVLTSKRAEQAVPTLRRLLTTIHRVNGHGRIALLCHSYGSVVCAKAAPHLAPLPVDEIALFGSPGTTADNITDLRTSARVWAGRAKGDWMRHVPNVRFAGLGFGPDPVSPGFGALRFDAGTGPHSAYLKSGSLALRNLALIALGRATEVTRA